MGSNEARPRSNLIHLSVGDARLRDALRSRLAGEGGLQIHHDAPTNLLGSYGLVVSTPADCSSDQVELLSKRGTLTIMVVPVLRDAERRRYEAAGALAYIAMDLDVQELVELIRSALSPTQR